MTSKERNASWLGQRERGSKHAMRLLVWITLGRRVGRWFLYPICAYFVAFSVRARRASADYLRRVLGRPPAWRDIFRHYDTYASTIHRFTDSPIHRFTDSPIHRFTMGSICWPESIATSTCGSSVIAVHHVKRCFPTCFRVTFHLAVSPIRGFLVGKPDSLGFTGETATPQPSTATGTPPHHAR